ncbi:MAG: class I SAM-dependent methyltransferase, partial [Beijerinckiaceae bacterium]
RYFDEVVGVDISDAMLAEAKRNCAGSPNISLIKSDDSLSRINGKFDLVHSYVVLQHIPINRGMQLTQKMLELVEDDGVAALHYSIQRTLSPLKAIVYGIKHHVPFGRQVMNLIQRCDWNLPVMQMNNYPLPEILRCFERNGFEDLIIVPEWHSVALTVWIFGKRSASS